MEPPPGAQEPGAPALQPTLRLLVGFLVPCLLLLLALNCLLLLGWRPTCRRVGGGRMRRGELGQGPPASPQLFQVVSGSALVRQEGNGRVVLQQLLRPAGHPGGLRALSAPSGSRSTGTPRPHRSSQAPRRGRAGNGAPWGAASTSSSSSSRDQDKQPTLAPPNTPASASGTGASNQGIPDGTFSHCQTSTQNKVCRSSRRVPATHLQAGPFEHASSIRCEDQRVQFNSANFTASQGPGLDSDFGASAGVSVRILSDCEGSPGTPLLGRLFEWDYYDPTYQRDQLPQHLPPIHSKQYWL